MSAGVTSIVAGRKALPLIPLMPMTVVVLWTGFTDYGLPEKDFPSLSPLIDVRKSFEPIDLTLARFRIVALELAMPGH